MKASTDHKKVTAGGTLQLLPNCFQEHVIVEVPYMSYAYIKQLCNSAKRTQAQYNST